MTNKQEPERKLSAFERLEKMNESEYMKVVFQCIYDASAGVDPKFYVPNIQSGGEVVIVAQNIEIESHPTYIQFNITTSRGTKRSLDLSKFDKFGTWGRSYFGKATIFDGNEGVQLIDRKGEYVGGFSLESKDYDALIANVFSAPVTAKSLKKIPSQHDPSNTPSPRQTTHENNRK